MSQSLAGVPEAQSRLRAAQAAPLAATKEGRAERVVAERWLGGRRGAAPPSLPAPVPQGRPLGPPLVVNDHRGRLVCDMGPV